MTRLDFVLLVTVLSLAWPIFVKGSTEEVEDFQLSLFNRSLGSLYQHSGGSGRAVPKREVAYVHPFWEKFGEFDGSGCSVSKKLKREIAGYKEIVEQILAKATEGYMKGETLKHLAHFTDYFGSRVAGSVGLEKAINFLARQLLNIRTLAGHVYTEDVELPNWQR